MATPIRERILTALLARAKKAHSSARRDVPLYNDQDLPKLILWDAQESNQPGNYGSDSVTLGIVIDYAQAINGNVAVSTVANTQLAKIIDSLQDQTDPHLGGLIERITYRNSSIDYPEAGRGVLGVRVTFEVEYRMKKGDPYNV